MNPRIKARKRKLKSALNAGERCKSKSAVPSRDYSNERTPPREPEGRAGCPQPAGNGAKPPSLLRRGEDTAPYLCRTVQGFKARIGWGYSLPIPLPIRWGEGEEFAVRRSVSKQSLVQSRTEFHPLPLGREEDRGEGLAARREYGQGGVVMSALARETKSELRSRVRAALKQISVEEATKASSQACALLRGQTIWRQVNCVLLYSPLALELDLSPLM